MHQTLPLTRDLVLIGGGHSHALVLHKWGMDPLPGVRLTLINPGPTAPYSGMLPGHVAGHYPRAALDIDLVRLARFAGARVVLGAARHIDSAARLVHVPGRAPLAYDVASVDIGITSAMPDLPGFAEHAVPAKPLGDFADAWAAFRARSGPARVAVLGGGVAGAELAMAMAHALTGDGRAAEVVLVERARAFSALRPAAGDRLRRALAACGVTLREGAEVTSVSEEGLTLTDGSTLAADFVTGAAGAFPHGWLAMSGLVLHEGFIEVDAHLRTSDPAVFAVGDCAHMTHAPRPKAGVYAVRQAPVLFYNLRACLSGSAPKRRYQPQGDYLKLISLGRKSALADRFGIALGGPLLWRWKDRIDQGFMQKFRDLPAMPAPALPKAHAAGMAEELGPKPLCGGCGSKLGRGALMRALGEVGGPGDDAAVLQTGGVQQVISTDHLRAMVADPAVMARIAAVHALGDVWAMGARPQAALLSVILPRQSEAMAERAMTEILAETRAVLAEAGARLAGGHSIQGAELTIGLTVTGICDAPPITLEGARPGDALVLTKPLGSGVVMAAEMALQAAGADVAAALEAMCRPQGAAAAILGRAHAMTDVTGFGLAGHLANICAASGVGARLDLSAVPFLPGAVALAAAGIRSSLFAENRLVLPEAPDSPQADLLFDPQTGGGLLAAVGGDGRAELAALKAAGVDAAVIGQITDRVLQIEIA
ncbi:MAG: selenide, water dikinase SelD [Rhodobacteraceae bacterium]|nr:MAG: selenide, water dikinase SelD [Paracoccaceae bacterium]